jgi:mannosyltransferase
VKVSHKAYILAVAALMLLGAALRTWSLGDDSLWSDETFTAFFADAPAAEFFDLLLTDGVHVPLYFILMRFVPTDTDLMLRLPSLLLGIAGIPLLAAATRHLYGRRDLALLAALLLACNPYHVWFSRMARPYTLFFVVALMVSFLFLVLLRGERSPLLWIAFLVASAAAHMTHFFAVGLPIAQFFVLAFVLRGDRRFYWRWVGAQALAAIPLAIWLVALGTQDVISFGVAWIPDPRPADLPLTLSNLGAGYDGTAGWLFAPALVALAAGLALGIAAALRRPREQAADLYWFWLMVVTLLPVFAISFKRPLYVDRYFMLILPGVLLLALRGWQRLPARVARPALPIALAALLALTGSAHILTTLASGDNERQDWQGAARYIAESYQPGDAFGMEVALVLLPLLRYYDETVTVHANLFALPPGDGDNAGRPPDRTWTVCVNPNQDIHRQGLMPAFDPFEPGPPTATWLRAHRDDIIARQDFNGLSVLLVASSSADASDD